MDGFELAGRPIRVSVAQEPTNAAPAPLVQTAGASTPMVLNALGSLGGAMQMPSSGGGAVKQLDTASVAALDSLDDGLGGGKMNAAQVTR